MILALLGCYLHVSLIFCIDYFLYFSGKFFGKDETGAGFKAALLSGPPGIGKTTTATLVCKVSLYSQYHQDVHLVLCMGELTSEIRGF